MRAAGQGSTPFLSWDGILDGSGDNAGSYLDLSGPAAAGSYSGQPSIPPPRATFVDAYRAAFGKEPNQHAAAAYACMQVVLASLQAIAEDGPDPNELGKPCAPMPSIPPAATRRCSARSASTPTATRPSRSSRCSGSTPRRPVEQATGS